MLLTIAASIVAFVILYLIVVVLSLRSESRQISGPMNQIQDVKSALTDHEYALARNLVKKEILREDAVLTSATAIAIYGEVTDSNVGYACTSGRLLYIKLIGDFPHITTTGLAVKPGDPSTDLTVHAIVITADGETGRACQIGVQTGNVLPDKGAVSLPIK